MSASAATRRRRARDRAEKPLAEPQVAPEETGQPAGRRGSFLRVRSRLWIDPEFRVLSHAAVGLQFRLHSFLDDQENSRPTGWKFSIGDAGAVGMFAGENAPAPLLDELIGARVVADLGGGSYRVEDMQAPTFEEREAAKARWRIEKSRQRRTQVSAPDSGAESEAESGEESGGDS